MTRRLFLPALCAACLVAYLILAGRPEDAPSLATYRLSAADLYWRAERLVWKQEKQLGRLGREVRRLRREARQHRARLRTLQHVRVPAGSTSYAIRLAASAFRISEAEMRSVADCETGGTFSATAYNASSGASGLFQFLSGTWATQGMAGFSVFDPVANALAAARIVAREGWGQWSCRP